MNADASGHDGFRETIGCGHSTSGKGAGKGRRWRSAKQAPHPKRYRGHGAAQIVREWRQVYQNLYEA